MHTIRAAAPCDRVYFASEFPRWFLEHHKSHDCDVMDLLDIGPDLLVVSGMVCSDEFIRTLGPGIEKAARAGVRIIFNGVGCKTYSDAEISRFKKFLEKIPVSGFISRDEVTYDRFRGSGLNVFNGIDCAFFLPDAHDPLPLRLDDYVAYNFDYLDEPETGDGGKIIRTHHAYLAHRQRNSGGSLARRIKSIYGRSSPCPGPVMVSDIPEDYLNVYANVRATYSDRVHACVATLSYGNVARLYARTPRAYLFDRVGAGDVKVRPVRLDLDRLAQEREQHVSYLKEAIRSG